MTRSVPSYAPIARADETADPLRRQRGHVEASRLMTRQLGSGSPHCRHNGGVSGTMALQHRPQTAPRVGRSSGVSHAAQRGAISTAIRLSAIVRTVE
jgi:hypothetical protein